MHLNKEITSGIKTFEEQYFYRCHFIEQSPLRFILYLLYTEPRIVAVFQKNVGFFLDKNRIQMQVQRNRNYGIKNIYNVVYFYLHLNIFPLNNNGINHFI